MALTGECSTVEARTATGGFRYRRPIAVGGSAALVLSLVASLALGIARATPALADQSGPDRVAALTAKVNSEAAHIHQLTEQLDQARLKVNTTSTRLAGVTHQHDATLQGLGANRAILLDQALRAYMRGGITASMSSASTSAAADLTVGREYLKLASGDLAQTGDQLRQLEASLRADQAMLMGAQQANMQATTQLQLLRTNALSVAASDQVQLDSLQTQLAAQAASAASAKSVAAARPATQGLPVNNGLVAVVQQAAGLPVATPVATAPTTASTPSTVPVAASGGSGGGGGHAGGVWLSLRRCESGDNYAENTGNGYYGAYQFSQSTWTGLGFPGRPDQESPAMQDEAAMKLQAQSGWGQWPACAAALGLI
jgi:hypothetical protein